MPNADRDEQASFGYTPASTQAIDLNHATVRQLMDIDGIREEQAHALVEHRKLHGHFRTWADLKQVPGVDEALIACVQHAARIGGIETPA